jgi:hypothetical protein
MPPKQPAAASDANGPFSTPESHPQTSGAKTHLVRAFAPVDLDVHLTVLCVLYVSAFVCAFSAARPSVCIRKLRL